MYHFSNRTPHPLTIIAADAPASAATSSGAVLVPAAPRHELARVRQDSRPVRGESPIPLVSGGWGSIVGLDSPQPGTVQIVSVQVVLAAVAQGRTIADLAVPGDQVRDETGRIVACRGLTMGADAFPRAHWQRLPRVVIFGSAARWIEEERQARHAIALGQPVSMRPPAPKDIDVAYVGMDESAARELVGDWLRSPGCRLREIFRDLPLDLHCTAQLGDRDTLAVPRPARLVGDLEPQDEAVIPVFGGDGGVAFVDIVSLPSIFRRAAALLAKGWTVDRVVTAIVHTWPHHINILVGDAGETRDVYTASSTAALGRAIDKLGEHRSQMFAVLLECGMPVATLERLAFGEVHEDAIAAMKRGAPSGCGAICRITKTDSVSPTSWCIGTVHGGPVFAGPVDIADSAAASWLRFG